MRGAGEREGRLRVLCYYYALSLGIGEGAQTYQPVDSSYPRDDIPHGNLGSNFTALAVRKSVAETQEARSLNQHVIMATEPRTELSVPQSAGDAKPCSAGAARKLDASLPLWMYYSLLRAISANGQQLVGRQESREQRFPCLLPSPIPEGYYGR